MLLFLNSCSYLAKFVVHRLVVQLLLLKNLFLFSCKSLHHIIEKTAFTGSNSLCNQLIFHLITSFITLQNFQIYKKEFFKKGK